MKPWDIKSPNAARRPLYPFAINQDSPQSEGLEMWVPVLPDPGDQRDLKSGPSGVLTANAFIDSDIHGRHVVDLDGTGDYVSFTDALSNASGAVNTVSMWMVDRGEDANGAMLLGSTTGTAVYWQLVSATGNIYICAGRLTGGPDLRDSLIHHVAMRSDGVDVQFYLDGVIVTGLTQQNGPLSMSTGAKTFQWGAYPAGADWDLNGRLWDLRFYSVALSAQVIWEMYDSPTRWDLYAPGRERVYWFVAPSVAVAEAVLLQPVFYD